MFMKRLMQFVLYVLSAISAVCSAAPRSTADQLLRVGAWNAVANIPMISKAPEINGVFANGEWDKAAQISGFSLLNGNYVTNGTGFVRLMRDKNFLYLAIRTTTPNNDPGGSLVANVLTRDGKVFQDDSLDLMLVSDTDTGKLYHFIINSRDAVYDSKVDFANGKKADVSWNIRNLKCRSHVDKGFWDMELAMPLSEIGTPKSSFKFNIGRNWSSAGTSLLNPSGAYFDVKRMITVRWRKDQGIMRQLDPGDVGRGEWELALEADNPTEKPLTLAVMLRHNTYAKIKGKSVTTRHQDVVEKINIAPGRSGSLKAEFSVDDNARYHYSAVLFEPSTGRIHASRNFAGVRGNTERHPLTCSFTLKGVGSGDCRYYPGYDKAVLFFRPANKETVKTAVILPDNSKVSGIKEKGGFKFRFPVPSTAGKYDFTLDVDGKTYPKAFQLEKRFFSWLGSKLGCDKIVLPPFEPLKSSGAEVKLLLSKLKLNGCGLWDEFISENVSILASPIQLEAVVNGKTEHFSGIIADPVNNHQGYDLIHSFIAGTPSGLSISGKSRIEYDGFQYLNFTLAPPGKNKLERLTLKITLKNSEAPFFHAISNFIRENPSGRIPAGEGLVWEGSKLPRRTALGQETLHPQVVPYIYLGGVSRGISCFVENTAGFALDRKKSAVRIIRNKDKLILEWDIINRPVNSEKYRKFAFGLMPTPVKKVDPAMHQYTHDTSALGAKTMKNFTFIGGQLMGFSPWKHDAFAGDWELFRAACRAVRAGGKDNMAKELDLWLKKYEPALIREMKQVPNAGEYPMHYSRVRKNFRRFQLDNPARRPALPYKYTDPKLTWIFEDVPEYFRAEWFNPAPQSYFGARRITLTPSALDYMVDALHKELLNGAHGIYLDDMYLMPDPNVETVAVMDDEGVVHPANGILAMRELVKRVAVLQHKLNLYPRLLQIHMTNALLIPSFSLATSTLGWENHYGDTPLPTRFKVDDILATGTGLQLGTENCVLGGIKRKTYTPKEWKNGKYRWLTRTLIALSLPFGAKFKAPVTPAGDAKFYFSVIGLAGEFGFWKPECKFVPFWENAAADLCVNDAEVLASSWRFPGRVLLVLGNLSGKEKVLKLSVNASNLALKDGFKIINAETRNMENAQKIVLPPYDFKLLVLE